jgi:hypothetical protein
VRSVSTDGVAYHFIPDVFYFAPLHFEPIIDDYGLSFPELSGAVLSGAVLAAFANAITRPSAEFPGAVEELRLVDGIIVSSVERLKGRRISETRYRNGLAVSQRVDIDLDGRLETIRYFSQNSNNEREIEYIEVDWTGNGIYERE